VQGDFRDWPFVAGHYGRSRGARNEGPPTGDRRPLRRRW